MINALLLRSQLEFSAVRKIERAMLQLEQIVQDWHSKEFALYERLDHIYTIQCPSFIKIVSSVADSYRSIGSFMSAAELYKDVGMLEECIEC